MAAWETLRWTSERITEKELEEVLDRGRGKVYKPCWDLRFCPYGILVEFFPLPEQVTRAQAIARIEHIKKSLKEGAYSEQKASMFKKEVEIFDPLDYPETEDEIKFKSEACKHFGHICPVFFTAEYLENSKELMRRKMDISILQRNRVAARNANLYCYVCQKCGRPLEDYEVGFDREYKTAKIVIRCSSCTKRAKS